MTDHASDTGILFALLERFENNRLPRVLQIKEKVDNGALLEEHEILFLEHILEDAQLVEPYIDRHPEHQELFARIMHLYHEVTGRALENEKNAQTK